jgi:putative ABC transport system substrate-binding protein
MAGTAQADRAAIIAGSCPSGFGESCRHCAVWGYSRYGSSLGVDVSPIDVRNASEIERDIAAFARIANGGLIVTGSAAEIHHDLIIAVAARYKLPAVYNSRLEAADGGLISYGPDFVDQFRSAAGYVDRILKGEKPGDLPVQAPTKFELIINMKTAKALGLAIPAALQASADEVIE